MGFPYTNRAGAAVCAEDTGYETFDHTADVGLRVWAPTLRCLFEAAGRGLVGMLFDAGAARADREMPIEASGEDPEEMLVGWLSEILLAFEVDRFVPARVEVTSMGDSVVAGQLLGEDFDRDRHKVKCGIKAVTYHDLEIAQCGGRYEVRIVFDV